MNNENKHLTSADITDAVGKTYVFDSYQGLPEVDVHNMPMDEDDKWWTDAEQTAFPNGTTCVVLEVYPKGSARVQVVGTNVVGWVVMDDLMLEMK